VASAKPKVVLRLGSHAEKDYFLKTTRLWDGLIVGANLLEAAPGATSSLIFRFAGEKHKVPYYIDPMTYAFGAYVEHGATEPRTDLDWIKSDQKNRKTKKIERLYKRSYLKLAEELGGAILGAVQNDEGIAPAQLNAADIAQLAQSVVQYQLTRVRNEFAADLEYAAEADKIPLPTAVFAPYFYIDPNAADQGLQLLFDCANAAKQQAGSTPVHAVLCTDTSMLRDPDFLEKAAAGIKASGVVGVWLWFSRFYEEAASGAELLAFRHFILDLKEEVEVYNMHGGYFSLALSRVGLNGVSHGVGYGEQKDVIPVIGQSTPTVRYYLPDLKRRLGVPQIERALSGIGVTTAQEFFDKVCACAICRGVLGTDLKQFSSFGDLHYSTAESQRKAQTPAAAQRCRFHFLLNRARERDELNGLSSAEIAATFADAHTKWAGQPTVRGDAEHLLRWKDIFELPEPTSETV
jgi:hypothetical protein